MTLLDVPDRFQVLAEIAATEAEVVLRARDRVLQREVFLLCQGAQLQEAFRDRDAQTTMLREARALARVRHPYVVRLLDVVETGRGLVLVIEPFSGEPLADRLAREGKLEPEETLTLARKLAEALEAVHTADVVHRGISSSCIVLGADGTLCLTGFCYSKRGSGTGSALTSILYRDTRSGADGAKLSASPSCPAPEQLLGQTADKRSDLFSLACVLFECLTGQPPFDSANPFARKGLPNPAKLVAGAPRSLTRAIVHCLEHDPGRRLESATALRKSLKPESRSAPAPTEDEARAPVGRPWAWALTVSLLGLVAVMGGMFLMGGSEEASDEPGGQRTDLELIDTDQQQSLAELIPEYEKSYAFLIGIGDAYDRSGFQPLANAERDVAAVEASLRGLDREWEITTFFGEEASRKAIVNKLHEIGQKTSNNDRVFIYFAGHGLPHDESEDSGWVIPADATKGDWSSYLRFDEFYKFFDESKAKHILVTMDCCYAGRMATMRSGEEKKFSDRFLREKAHVVIASGRGDEQVVDGEPGEHSPFARVMIETLNGSGPVTSSMMFARIQEAFLKLEDVKQTPRLGYSGAAQSEFVFFRHE